MAIDIHYLCNLVGKYPIKIQIWDKKISMEYENMILWYLSDRAGVGMEW
jgi:hypothetical protein